MNKYLTNFIEGFIFQTIFFTLLQIEAVIKDTEDPTIFFVTIFGLKTLNPS